MPRALHHHHAHHVPHRSANNTHSWLLPREGSDWIALILLLFGLGLIAYAVLADAHQDDTLPAFSSRPSTYD
jgi:hypothetical protein